MTRLWLLLAAALALWVSLAPRTEAAQSTPLSFRVEDCQLTTEGGRTILSLHFSLPPTALRTHTLPAPPQLIIDVQGPTTMTPSVTYPLHDPLLWRVRVGSYPLRAARRVLRELEW